MPSIRCRFHHKSNFLLVDVLLAVSTFRTFFIFNRDKYFAMLRPNGVSASYDALFDPLRLRWDSSHVFNIYTDRSHFANPVGHSRKDYGRGARVLAVATSKSNRVFQ